MNKAVLWLIIIILYSCGIQRKELLGKVSPDGKTYIAKDSLFKMTIPEQYSSSFNHIHTGDEVSEILYKFRYYPFFFNSLEMLLVYKELNFIDFEVLTKDYLLKNYTSIKDVYHKSFKRDGVFFHITSYLGEGVGPFTENNTDTPFYKMVMMCQSPDYTIIYDLHMDVFTTNNSSFLNRINEGKSKFLLNLFKNTTVSIAKLKSVRDSLNVQ